MSVVYVLSERYQFDCIMSILRYIHMKLLRRLFDHFPFLFLSFSFSFFLFSFLSFSSHSMLFDWLAGVPLQAVNVETL